MKPKNKRETLKTLALALALGAGLATGSAQAQAILEVAGDNTIGDEVLTTDAGVAKVPVNGTTWTTPGGGAGGGNTAESFLVSPDIVVPTTGSVTLRFSHRYFFEANWDGGAVFVSVNGAAATYVPSASFSAGTYDGTTGANPGTAWTGGEEVFTGKSIDYDSTVSNLVDSVVDLGSLTMGDTVSVEFRGIWDEGFAEADTNWEVATVTLEDSVATPFLDVDFITDGRSGFTVESNANVNGADWTYPLPVNTFEIDADLLTADRYAPDIAGTTTTIDLNGATIKVELLAGTLVISDSFTIFDLSGGTTLTGAIGKLTLPTGNWDTSALATTGTITYLGPVSPASQLGVLDLAANGGINPNTGDPWAVGDRYRIAFLTNDTTQTTSNDPQFYRDFVTAQAWDTTTLTGSYFTPMITLNLDSNFPDATAPLLTAREFSGTTDLTGGAGIGGAGGPVYVVDGTTCIARNNADIWNGWSNPFDGDTTVRTGSVHYSPYLTQFGTQPVSPDANHGADVATGCSNNGGTVRPLGTSADANPFDINRGSSNANNSGRVWNRFGSSAESQNRLYAISYPLTIIDTNDPVAPTPVSIEDGQGGADSILGLDPIVYTVTFSEAMDIGTIDTTDFANTGSATATVTIDSVGPTFDPAAFLVTVTPTSTGTVQLQINAGADLKDLVGNAMDTSSAFLDDTTINVVLDTTAPTLTSIEDSVAGANILAFTGLTYTVTFDEAMDSGTIDTTDFANGGSAPITVDSVSATGNPAIFEVAVSTTGPGDLTLEIVMGASLTDLVGNPLDTSAALPDDTTITVDPDPLPTLVSIVDNQAGGPVFETQAFTYFVTFDQVIDPATVDVGDFDNSTAPAVTVNAVAATSDPSVFAVHVTPGGAGTLTLQIAAGAIIENTNGTAVDTTSALADDTTITVDAGSGPGPRSTITVDGTASWNANSSTLSGTLDASGSDKLVVIVTGENGNPGSLAGDCTGVTYDGVPLIQAVDRGPIAANPDTGYPFDQTYNDIWYLDNPATSTGAIVASVNSRGNVTAFALSGTAPGVGQTAVSAQASKSAVLSTSFAGSIVIASHGMGGDGNSANVTSVNADPPLIEVSALENGNNWDGHVTAWALAPTAGTATYSFAGGNLTGTHTLAAEFTAAVDTSDYTAWSAMFVEDLSDPDADFDGDGLTNDYERIFGLDPTAANSLDPFTTGLFEGTTSTFAFSRRDDALTGLFTDIETSFDLEMWTEDGGAVLVEGTVDGSTMIEIVEVTLSPGLLTAPKLFVRVNQNDGTLFSENFEAGDGGFTVATAAGTDWEHGMPDSQGFGANAVTEGNGGSMNCWGTNLGDFSGTTADPGSYADSTVTSLRSAIIDLTGVAGAELLFAEALDIEAGDTAAVYIIDDTTDTVIAGPIYTAVDGDDAGAGWGNVGPIAIPGGALGQPIRIEWRFTGFGGATDDYLGWYVDDVTVRETMP